MTPTELHEHVNELSRELGVPVSWRERDPYTAHYDAGRRLVSTAEFLDYGWKYGVRLHPEAVYLITLHELGHAAHKHAAWRDHRHLLEQEADAWAWALDRSAITPDPDAAATALNGLTSYRHGAPASLLPARYRDVTETLRRWATPTTEVAA